MSPSKGKYEMIWMLFPTPLNDTFSFSNDGQGG
jgi:hypothetical protein